MTRQQFKQEEARQAEEVNRRQIEEAMAYNASKRKGSK